VSGSVQFRPEQISTITDSVSEQRWPDDTITNVHTIFFSAFICVMLHGTG